MLRPGRPSLYSQALADEIAERLAEGETLKSICADSHMPNASTVFRWEIANDSFRKLLLGARETGAHSIVGEAREIADDGTNDWMAKHGSDAVGWQINGECVARSRLRVDQRWKEAQAIAPRTFGIKHQIEHSGSITITTVDEDELRAELIELIASGKLKLPGGLEVEERDESAADDDCEFV